MSESPGLADRLAAANDRLDESAEHAARWLFAAVFGDRVGAAVFLAALLFFALYWRVELFSTDNYMHMNTLVAVSEGHLDIQRFVYGPSSGQTPGVHYVDGHVYGDNYGMILTSLPAFLFYRALSALVDLRIALAAAWSLGLLGLTALLRSTVDRARERSFVLGGSAFALLAFLVNVAVATPLSTRWLPLLALQTTTMLSAALVAVVVYRLCGDRYGRRVGVAAGVATFAATPVGFWAVAPKRHSITALFAVATVYAFYRSRRATTLRGETRFRALTYAIVGVCTWFHAAEALIYFVALAPVDLATARTNRLRSLAAVAVAFGLSLLPFLVTNAVVAGNPLEPLRLLPNYRGQPVAGNGGSGVAGSGASAQPAGTGGPTPQPSTPSPASSADPGSAAGSGPASTPGGSGADPSSVGDPNAGIGTGTGLFDRVAGAVSAIASQAAAATATLERNLSLFENRATSTMDVLTDTDRLATVFLRSGYRPRLPSTDDVAVNLSVLESMPLLGLSLALPFVTLRFARSRTLNRPTRKTPSGTRFSALRSLTWSSRARESTRAFCDHPTDLLVVATAAVLVVFYLPTLPLHHMLTVRYLHPLYPLGVYGVVRLSSVRTVVETRTKRLAATYFGGVALGVPAYLSALVAVDAVLGEAVQLYALVAFGVGVATACWAVVSVVRDGPRVRRVGALAIGLAAATMTTYLLVAGVGLFSVSGEFALPVSRVVGDALVGVNPLR